MIESREEPMHRVLALSGWKGSGKDTVADYLVREYGYTKLSFAATLKDMVATTYGIERSWLDDPSRKEQPLSKYPVNTTDAFTSTMHTLLSAELSTGFWTPRALCILEGSIKRSVDSNFWVRSIAEYMVKNPEGKYVISDMRYRSEAHTIRLFIPETKILRVERYMDIETSDPSERDMDSYSQFHARILNTSDVSFLYRQVDRIITEE